MEVSEKSFESTIEDALLQNAKEIFGEFTYIPGGFRKRDPREYDRDLCLIPDDVIDFILATQPKEWVKLKQHYGEDIKDKFLSRLHREIQNRGLLDVLRQGVKDTGCRFQLAYFHPASGLNAELQRLYQANVFTIVRQLRYSSKNENSIDLVLFLNGLPIFTAELKNPLTGQTVKHAVRQYKFDRDPRELLLAFRRCLAHFAVDPDWVFVTTRLEGRQTVFLPFNQGKYGGAGNPPVPPTQKGYATAYLWERIWSKNSILNLVKQFVHEIEEEDDKGRKTGKLRLIFPRYHQLDSVRALITHARQNGAGRKYLIQHSAGSGKSNSIAWLAHQLSILHDAGDRRVFDSIIVITDRRILDRQLQRTVRQFEQVDGLVENIDKTSRQLKEALELGKNIIVTTLQKFPVIADEIGAMPGKKFAVVIDEAHSSQTGESTKSLKQVLAANTLAEAEKQDQEEEEDLEDRIIEEMKRRGQQVNVSYFAFTATPKFKTLELFGTRRADDSFEAFSLYSMRQAIEEGFILDVLENYTTYKVYWELLKKISSDPRYEKDKANYLLRRFVDLHEHAILKKLEVMVEHFHEQVAPRIKGKAKAMIVTRSRLHAVRYKQALDRYLKDKKYPYKALVAFSGTVRDEGQDYTEAGMNGFSEKQTAKMFERGEYRFLVVANKFQTGFDQPMLHTMYVDKKLGGVNTVQTLSRLNRVHPDKEETMVLDFVNEADDVQLAFKPYYEKTILSEATDPNLLYDLESRLAKMEMYDRSEIDSFAGVWFSQKGSQDQLYSILAPVASRYERIERKEQTDFRGLLTDYIRLYAFLSQIIPFTDTDLEKLYVFARMLRRRLPDIDEPLPIEVQKQIDMEKYQIKKKSSGKIDLPRGEGIIDPIGAKGHYYSESELEALSKIISELNERFGTDFSEEDKVFIRQLEEKLSADESLGVSIQVNSPENARLTFDQVVSNHLQDMVETNFEFYKRVNEDPEFSKFFLSWLFDRFKKYNMQKRNN